MNDPLVVTIPVWAVLGFFLFLSGFVAMLIAINTQFKAVISLVFGNTREAADRWNYLLECGAQLEQDEDGDIVIVVPFKKRMFDFSDDLQRYAFALEQGPIRDPFLVTQFVDRMRGGVDTEEDNPPFEERVGDITPGMMA